MKAQEFAAHAPDEVLNQPTALENYNLFAGDAPLREALQREGGGWIEEQAHEFGVRDDDPASDADRPQFAPIDRPPHGFRG